MSTKDKRSAFKLLTAACLTLLLIPGCSLLPKEEEALKPPLVQPVKENYELAEVKKGTITKQLAVQAKFVSSRMEQLSYKENGYRLASIKVNLGDTVKPGDVLAELEKGDLEARIRLQRLNLEKAQIALEQTKQSQGNDQAAVRLKAIDVEAAQIQLSLLQEQLAKTKLVAESEGIVTFIDPIQQGTIVPAFKTIMTIANPKHMQLVYEALSSSDLTGIQLGMEVKVKLKSGETKGRVLQTPANAPVVLDNKEQSDRNARTLIIGVDVPGDVKIGDAADITIVTEQREDTLIMPRSGLRSYLGREYVQVLEGESRKEVNVEKGIMNSTEVEIRKGLKEGQKVILNN